MASKEILAKKKEEVKGIADKIEKSQSVVLVDYRGLTVLEATALRTEFRKENVEYKVIKNRILLRALEAAGYTGFEKILEGPTAVAFGYDDAVTPAKILSEQGKKLNKLVLKGGVAEGNSLSAEEMVAFSKIPPKPILLAQLLGLLTHPMRSLAVAISEVAKKKPVG